MSPSHDPPEDKALDDKAEVIRRLCEHTPAGATAKAHLFLDVPDDQVEAAVRRLFQAAEAASPPGAPPKLGRIHTLARSVSIEAEPKVLASIVEAPDVRAVLPAEVDDILPRPVDVRRVD